MQPRGRRRWDAIPDRKLSEYDELTQAIIGAAIILVGEFYLDYLVEDAVVVELKALEQVSQVHLQQVITYITILGRELGLLLNFGSGILQPKRVIPPKAVQASQPYQQRVQAWKPVWTRQSRRVRE
jgi:GxxExxY protein